MRTALQIKYYRMIHTLQPPKTIINKKKWDAVRPEFKYKLQLQQTTWQFCMVDRISYFREKELQQSTSIKYSWKPLDCYACIRICIYYSWVFVHATMHLGSNIKQEDFIPLNAVACFKLSCSNPLWTIQSRFCGRLIFQDGMMKQTGW